DVAVGWEVFAPWIAGREELVVPRPRRAVDRAGRLVEELGDPGGVRSDVAVDPELDRRLPASCRIPDDAEPRIEVLPVGDVGASGERAGGKQETRIDRGGLHRLAKPFEAHARTEREVLQPPLVLDEQPEIRV